MPEDKETLYYDEDTLKKVYEGLMAAGVYGQTAVDAVNQIQNRHILFREAKPKRRGRPPKDPNRGTPPTTSGGSDAVAIPIAGDEWTPKEGESAPSTT